MELRRAPSARGAASSTKDRTQTITTHIRQLGANGRALLAHWKAAAVLALAIAIANGFWLTAVQGTVGAIELNEPPFFHWLRATALLLPLMFVAVLLALLVARRWFARSQPALSRLGATVLLVALVSGVGIAAVGANSLRCYQVQLQHLELIHAHGAANQPGPAAQAGFGRATPLSYYLYVCGWRGRRVTGEVHDENAASLGGVAGHAGIFSTAAEIAAFGQV